jgi:hypothetical protein
MKNKSHWLAAVMCLAAASSTTAAEPETDAEKVERSLARLVNQHALPWHMIVGKSINGSCVLSLEHNFRRAMDADTGAAQSRIFRELELSQLRRDIRRYNAPRTLADQALFRVDSECSPVEYVPQIAEFRPPKVTSVGAFKVQYPSDVGAEALEVEVTTAGKTHKLAVRRQQSPDVASELDLARPRGPIDMGEEDLVLKWNGDILVDWSLGRWPVLRSFRLDSKTRMRVHAGGSVAESDVTTATTGSMLAFPEGAVLTLLKYSANGEPVIRSQVSWRRLKTSQVLYSIDPRGQEFWGWEPTNFEAQIVRSLRAQRAVRPEVTLTFDRALNAQLQAILDPAIKAASKLDPYPEVYGSIVMMDVATGDFIGAVGAPTLAGTPRSLPAEAFVPDEQFREEFLRRRPIGSVAKAPIAYAIIANAPALADLTMQEYPAGKQHSILGIPLRGPFNEESNSARCDSVDFECFLRKSLNRYAATLITLAAIPRLDADNALDLIGHTNDTLLGKETFQIGNPLRTIDRQPRDLIWARTSSAEQLMALGWVRYAKENYDIDIAMSAGTGYVSSGVHSYMWRNALTSVDPMGMQMVSPERENLRLDQARYLRANYLSLILGGGESLWSSTKVAETFARTITGHRIRGSFVRQAQRPNWSALEGTNDDRVERARSRYLSGLSQVFVSGTGAIDFGLHAASLVARAKKARLELSIYAKSGTPTLEASGAGADEGETRHPIDEAFRAGTLGSVQTPTGLQIHFYQRPVTAALVETFKPAPASALTRQHLHYIALFNSLDAQSQALMCDVRGATFDCEWPQSQRHSVPPREGEGRNYAVYAALSDPVSKRPCRAVSMAVSFSSSKGDSFKQMLNALLEPAQGPLSRTLGLNDDAKGGGCERAV